jgi:prophage regulatory protein
MSDPLHPDDLILRHERKRLVPLSDTTVWRMERRGDFPRRIAISTKRVAWRRKEIEAWLARRESERPKPEVTGDHA